MKETDYNGHTHTHTYGVEETGGGIIARIQREEEIDEEDEEGEKVMRMICVLNLIYPSPNKEQIHLAR